MARRPSPVVKDTRPDRYVWIGGVTDVSFQLHVDVHSDETELLISTNAETAHEVVFRVKDPSKRTPGLSTSVYGALRHFTVTGLSARTRYHIVLRGPNRAKLRVGSVTTFPTAGHSAEVVLGLGTCQSRARDGEALAEIAAWREAVAAKSPRAAFAMLHAGDLHYGDISVDDQAQFETAVRAVVTAAPARALFRSTPVAYCWDDHDFGANNSNADSPSRPAALAAYGALVPSGAAGGTAYHAFTIARVRVVVTDLRSEADRGQGVLLAPAQLQFLLAELGSWREWDAVVWVNSRPWIETEKEGSDRWGGFAAQRREIANFIAANGVENLVVVSGDAHMLAVDDGSHSGYADRKYGDLSFPVLQTAPLANFGTIKGGPYSEGVKTTRLRMTRQYGILRIIPSGKGAPRTARLEFNGYRVTAGAPASSKELERKQPLMSFAMARPFLTKQGATTPPWSFNLIDWILDLFT